MANNPNNKPRGKGSSGKQSKAPAMASKKKARNSQASAKKNARYPR